MRFRTSSGSTNSQKSMTAMIDVVFLLLIFFMLTLQIVEPEGVHAIESQTHAGPAAVVSPASEVRVRLIATDDGQLAGIRLGNRSLGAGDEAIRRLNQEMQVLATEARGLVDDGLLVKIDADAHLHFEYSLRALGACQKHRYPNGTLESLGTCVQMVSLSVAAK